MAEAGGLVPLDSGSGAQPPAPWHVAGLPMQSKPFTRFGMVELDGKRVLRVDADRSYGNLVHPLPTGRGGAFPVLALARGCAERARRPARQWR